jgi:hypothetical protein
MDWRPATIAEVKKILERDLSQCDDQQLAVYHSTRFMGGCFHWPSTASGLGQ